MKKIGLFVTALLSTVASFAVDPHGSRVDYGGESSGGGGGAVFMVILGIIGVILYKQYVSTDSVKKTEPIREETIEEQIARRNKQSEAETKGYIWAIIIIATIVFLCIINN